MHNVFEACVLCSEEGTMYDNESKKYLQQKETMIDFQSPATQIISDAIEDGCSECQAVAIVNNKLLEMEEKFITRNMLRSITTRTKPVLSALEKEK